MIVIGFDVTFPEPERNLVLEMQERLGEESSQLINDIPRVQEALDGDSYFAEKMQFTDVALGMSFRANEALGTVYCLSKFPSLIKAILAFQHY